MSPSPPSPIDWAAVPGAESAYRLVRHPSGARIIVAPMRERASVSLALMFGVGSRHETTATTGLAHFIEHMVFKGARRYPTARAISEAIEGVGGALNAATDKEITLYWAKVPQAHLELAVDVLSDMVFHAGFDSSELRKERQVVIEELRMYQDNPQDYVHTLFDEVMWPGHPLGRDTAGTEATVRSFERDDCLQHLRRHYHADNLVISVAGALDGDGVAERLGAAVEGWGHGPRPVFEAAAPPPEEPRLRLLSKRTEQANLVVGARSASYLSPDRYPVDVLNAVLGEGMSSRLFLELRERRGLAYDVHSFTIKHRDTGCVGVYLGCEPRRAVTALDAAVVELQRLAAEPVAEPELEKAREYCKGRLLLQLEGTNALCNFLGQQELLCGGIETPAEVVARLDAVTAADLRRVAGEALASGLRGAVIGPFRSPEKFMTILTR